jgi:hypothetical protein
MLFKNSVHTVRKTQHFSMIKTNQSILFEEIITIYYKCHNYTNLISERKKYGRKAVKK